VGGGGGIYRTHFNALEQVHALDDVSKHNVLVVKPGT
jgi:hypothetical protein